MTISDGDITFTYSGGESNIAADLSLGGEPSTQLIVSKRLFDDVTEDETLSGVIDYRCFYLHNESETASLYEAEIFPFYVVPGDVTVQLGFDIVNERQNLTVTNATSLTGGSTVLTYTDATGDHDITVNFNGSLATWGTNLQTALRSIPNLENVVVSANLSGSSAIFEIDFLGGAAKRFHETIALKANSLLPGSTATVSIVQTVPGGPINRIADEIDVDTTTPNDIVFSSAPFSLGDIRPLDMIPIWVKRTVPANATAVANDGFVMQVKGNAIV